MFGVSTLTTMSLQRNARTPTLSTRVPRSTARSPSPSQRNRGSTPSPRSVKTIAPRQCTPPRGRSALPRSEAIAPRSRSSPLDLVSPPRGPVAGYSTPRGRSSGPRHFSPPRARAPAPRSRSSAPLQVNLHGASHGSWSNALPLTTPPRSLSSGPRQPRVPSSRSTALPPVPILRRSQSVSPTKERLETQAHEIFNEFMGRMVGLFASQAPEPEPEWIPPSRGRRVSFRSLSPSSGEEFQPVALKVRRAHTPGPPPSSSPIPWSSDEEEEL